MGVQVLEYVNAWLCLISWLMLFYSHNSRIAPFPSLSLHPFPDKPSDRASCISQTQLHNPPRLRRWSAWWLGYTNLLGQLLWTASREGEHCLSQHRLFLRNCTLFVHSGPDPDFCLQTSHCSERGLCSHAAYRFFYLHSPAWHMQTQEALQKWNNEEKTSAVEEECDSLLLHILHSHISLCKTTIDWP